MKLDSEQLPQRISRGLAPLYTIVGDEPLLALEAGDLLRAKARAEGYAERTLLMVESGFDWSSLRASGASLSLFAERRLLELRIPNGKPGKDGAEALIAYAGALPPDTVSLIHLPALDWQARKSAWCLALDEAGVLVEARPVPRERLPQWLAGRLARQKQRASEESLQFLADRVEGNLLAAFQEVQKLGLLMPEGELDAAEVRKAVLDVSRYDVDALSEALLGGDAAYFLRVLDGLRGEGVAPPLILWTIANDLRAAYRVAAAVARGASPQQAVRDARIFPLQRQNAFTKAARRWRPAELDAALLHAAQIDRLVKGLGRGDLWDELRILGLGLAGKRLPRALAI